MDSPGKNTGVGCHSLLQGIFPTQGSNPDLLHCRQTLYHLSHQEVKRMWYAYMMGYCVSVCSALSDFATPWTVACQASLSMEFPKQEYWSGVPSPSPGDLPTQGSNPQLLCLLCQQVDSLPPCHLGIMLGGNQILLIRPTESLSKTMSPSSTPTRLTSPPCHSSMYKEIIQQ